MITVTIEVTIVIRRESTTGSFFFSRFAIFACNFCPVNLLWKRQNRCLLQTLSRQLFIDCFETQRLNSLGNLFDKNNINEFIMKAEPQSEKEVWMTYCHSQKQKATLNVVNSRAKLLKDSIIGYSSKIHNTTLFPKKELLTSVFELIAITESFMNNDYKCRK